MQTRRIELQPAYVLHARRYRETSLIAEFFTASHGRVGVVARGVRAPRSSLRGLIQPFMPLKVTWIERHELGTLIGAESGGVAHRLQGRDLACGFYLNELLMRLLIRHDPHPTLFAAYEHALDGVGRDGQQLQALRMFEKQLLEEIGYGLILDHDVNTGETIHPDRRYCYKLEEGPVSGECPGERVISGSTLIALGSGQPMSLSQLKEARWLLQRALKRYLGDKPLKSRELVRGYLGANNRVDP